MLCTLVSILALEYFVNQSKRPFFFFQWEISMISCVDIKKIVLLRKYLRKLENENRTQNVKIIKLYVDEYLRGVILE